MPNSVKLQNQSYTYRDFISSVFRHQDQYAQEIDKNNFFGFPLEAILKAESNLLSTDVKSTAYFSMEYGIAPSIYNQFEQKAEIGLDNKVASRQVFSNDESCDELYKIKDDRIRDIPIYGGGLGVLAGDTLKSASDSNLSVVGIGILWHKGYFQQNFVHNKGQVAEDVRWDPCSYPGLIPTNNNITIETREGPLVLRLWKYYVYSYNKKHATPLILIDSDLEENSEHFRKLTDQLYRSDDEWWRIFQRSILGIGGIKALASFGYDIDCYHLNEGHAAFALIEKYLSLSDKSQMEDVKKKFVFTCHTPVAAGHDRFLILDLGKVLGDDYVNAAKLLGQEDPQKDEVNLTFMALNNCRHINAVAQKHGEVMHLQFPKFSDKIDAITNGIHLHTWISDNFAQLFDHNKDTFGNWHEQPENLRKIEQLRNDKNFRKTIFEAHQQNKRNLIDPLKEWGFKEDVLTVAWARRITGYKRPTLIFHAIKDIAKLAEDIGPVQIIIAGKAHPCDDVGGGYIDEILGYIDKLNAQKEKLKVVILGNYDTYLGKLLTNSVDVWLNNPLPPFEASGTSGMKAILNGVLQLSTLDGWIVEAADKDIGWIFGYEHQGPNIGNENELRLKEDSKELSNTLGEVMKLYYQTYSNGNIDTNSLWIDKMINCVKTSSFFTTCRMVKQYNEKMWS